MSDTPGFSSSPVLAVSIVVYFPDAAWLNATLQTLVAALAHVRHTGAMRRAKICLVDNQVTSSTSPFSAQLEDTACRELRWIESIVIAGQGNIGYGRANNLAIARCTECDFHQVLNPDVKLADDAITNALRNLLQNAACELLSSLATALSSRMHCARVGNSVADVPLCRVLQVRPRETPRGLVTA